VEKEARAISIRCAMVGKKKSKEYAMLDAIQVKDAYKKFGKESHPLWKGRNGRTETGKVVKVAVDHVSFTVGEGKFRVLGPAGSENPPSSG
jgi:hypothetical protein